MPDEKVDTNLSGSPSTEAPPTGDLTTDAPEASVAPTPPTPPTPPIQVGQELPPLDESASAEPHIGKEVPREVSVVPSVDLQRHVASAVRELGSAGRCLMDVPLSASMKKAMYVGAEKKTCERIMNYIESEMKRKAL